MSDVWYFAYGSNLNKEQVRERIGGFKETGPATLENHRLTFDIYSPVRNGGVADIVESKDDKVYGAVYRIPEEKLYKVEEAGLKSGRYQPKKVKVKYQGRKIEATAFEVVDKGNFIEPSEEYLETIIEGLKDHNYSDKIIRKVRKIAREIKNK